MKFSKAIVCRPCKSMINGLTSQNLGKPDFEKAQKQHQIYISELQKAGLDLIILESQEDFPDSCFVEDPAIVVPELAVITNLWDNSRKGEIELIEKTLKSLYSNIEKIQFPGTIEGGDVILIEKDFFVGISKRTNIEGINQFTEIVGKYGYTVTAIKLNKFLHLKTGLTYLGNGKILVSGELRESDILDKFQKIIVPDEEEYCGNSIMVNNKLFFPQGYPKTKKVLEEKGFDIVEIDTSEYRKIDGGLSCLSLRF